MKVSSSQILTIASRIIAQKCSQLKKLEDAKEYIIPAIEIAKELAENVPDSCEEDIDPKLVIQRAFHKIGSDSAATTLLIETIKRAEDINRVTAIAIIQKALALNYVSSHKENGRKTVIYKNNLK